MRRSTARIKSLEKATARFQASLNDESLAYLSGRGFTDEMIQGYRLGVVSEDAEPAYEPYVGRLSIPFLTPSGPVALRYRCLQDHDCKEAGHSKYLQGKGEADHLYNVMALHERHPAIATCEGEMDAMFVDTFVLPAVGVPGATKWKPHWTRLLEGYDRVFAIGDGDKAGREFTERLCELLPNAVAVVFPKGHDVNSFFIENGSDALESFILGEPDGS